MKKIYLTPETYVIHIQASQMIAESLGMKKGNVSEESAVLSKENQNSWGNVWDDDDE